MSRCRLASAWRQIDIHVAVWIELYPLDLLTYAARARRRAGSSTLGAHARFLVQVVERAVLGVTPCQRPFIPGGAKGIRTPDLLVAKVPPGPSAGLGERDFRCIGCILILVSELRGHTGGTWISRIPIRRSRAPDRAAGQPSGHIKPGIRPPIGWFRLAPTATKTQSLGIRSPREVMPFPHVRSRVRAANEGCRGRRRDEQASRHVPTGIPRLWCEVR
jgi:hypothetical protein